MAGVVPIGSSSSKKRKEKRWQVYSKAHAILGDGTLAFPDTTYCSAAGGSYLPVSSPPRESWILEYEGASFELAKGKVEELAKTLGLDRVRIVRVVDLETVLYPIS